jgi:hypothetical protein
MWEWIGESAKACEGKYLGNGFFGNILALFGNTLFSKAYIIRF